MNVEIGDCELGDRVIFNARGRAIDGEIVRVREDRRGRRRFHVRPERDVAFGAREWILAERVPVVKIGGAE